MKKNYLNPDKDFSFSQRLSSYFEIFFGRDFDRGGNTATPLTENLLEKREKVLNLLSIAEIQKAAGKYDDLRKTCQSIFLLTSECYPQKVDPRYRDVFLYGLAFSLFCHVGDFLSEKGFIGEALKFYQELLSFFPGDPAILKKVARTFYTMGPYHLAEAERLYRLILATDPGNLQVAENLGRVLSVSPNGRDEARLVYRDALLHCKSDLDKLTFYSHLLSLSPGDSDILLRMGGLYQRQGMFVEALDCLEKARDLTDDPEEIPALAHLYYLLNDLQKAKSLLRSLPPGEGEPRNLSHYLLGVIRGEEGRWDDALRFLSKVPPGSVYYWRAITGLIRIYLHRDDDAKAVDLARAIPPGQYDSLGSEFFEVCQLLDDTLQRKTERGAEEWKKYISGAMPSFYLKRDIYNKSMGTIFWRKYEALQVLGSGPAGQVLLGRERQKGVMVAIKHLYGDYLNDPHIVRRLQGILRIWRHSMGNNPCRVSIYEDTFYEGSFFYAMEYLERSLSQMIKFWAPAPAKVAIETALLICNALEHYYSCHLGSPHGGLKPGNILISANGELKISDFDFFSVLLGKRVLYAREIKKYPSFLETFYYFAPERFNVGLFLHNLLSGLGNSQGLETTLEGIDQRADFYSLGIILYQLATGFFPFEIGSVGALLAFHRNKKALIPPRSINPAVDPGLEEIIVTLTAREPARRFATTGEIKKALEEAGAPR